MTEEAPGLFNVEAEEAVIGALIINPDEFAAVHEVISSADFYVHRLGWIFDAMQRLSEKHEPVDYVTVSAELDRAGKLGEIGGQAFLTGLIINVPSSQAAVAYAQIVHEYSVRRRLVDAAQRIASSAHDLEKGLELGAAESLEAVNKALQSVVGNRIVSATDAASQLYDLVVERSASNTPPGVPTGLADFDRLLAGGLQLSDFVLVAARPGAGKTTFLDQVAINVAKLKHVYLWTGEMSSEQQFIRIVSSMSQVSGQKIRTGKLDGDEWAAFTNAIDEAARLKLTIEDTAMMGIPALRARLAALKAQKKLDLVVIDYAGLLQAPGKDEYQQHSYISRHLKLLAKEYNVPVLAAHQMSRAVESRSDRRPVLSDLRGSGTWEQDADIVTFIHQEDEDSIIRNLVVAKHRSGPVGEVKLIFRVDCTRFENYTPERNLREFAR